MRIRVDMRSLIQNKNEIGRVEGTKRFLDLSRASTARSLAEMGTNHLSISTA